MTATLTLRSALLRSGAVATMSMAAQALAPIPTPSLLRDGSRDFDFEIAKLEEPGSALVPDPRGSATDSTLLEP